MARGNDSESARRDLASQYGEHASAEGLILEHDSNLDPVRIAALNKPVDAEATKALDMDSIEPRLGGEVKAAAVRGGVLIVVEETPRGTFEKWHDADYLKNTKSKPEPDDDDKAPQGVKSEDIQKKLADLGIDKGDATNKDGFWALLPENARAELVAAAA